MCSSESTVFLLEMIFKSVSSSAPARPDWLTAHSAEMCCPSLTLRLTDPAGLLLHVCFCSTLTGEVAVLFIFSIYWVFGTATVWKQSVSIQVPVLEAWSPHCRSTWKRGMCKRGLLEGEEALKG